MNNNKFTFLLLLVILLLFKKQTYAQEPLTAVSAQYKEYCSNAHLEKMYVHTDKNFYLAGELLWFKIYNVDGALYQPADLSKMPM